MPQPPYNNGCVQAFEDKVLSDNPNKLNALKDSDLIGNYILALENGYEPSDEVVAAILELEGGPYDGIDEIIDIINPPPELLAVAYIDNNPTDGDDYHSGIDTLIAAIEDTNRDGEVSVGDTLIYGDYPLDRPDGSTTATFQDTDATITGINQEPNNTLIDVATDDSTRAWFSEPYFVDPTTGDPTSESREMYLQNLSSNYTEITDDWGASGLPEGIKIDTNNASLPHPGLPAQQTENWTYAGNETDDLGQWDV